MALGQDARNRLQRFVNDARELLTDEFTRQLQQDYGMDPESGTVSELASLTHLDDPRLETAQLLRDIRAHYLGAAQGSTAKKAQQDVLLRIGREQAFTVLNRLVALRMMEERGLVQECVAQSYQSKGFELYARLVGPALGNSGNAYRRFLFSLFDELAVELPQLFDRYSPQGRLFPRDTALLDLLALINDQELKSLWAEDETIGWIYQYFNSQAERRQMRDESAAPRSSRELAVRNQFFTPRYVVEFLVDNSLGRAWFDWTGGQTELCDRCQYLLRNPDDAPELSETTVRDPRGIKLLDPACGSMHFGLYAFDLFEVMYSEAWDWEQANGSGSLKSDEKFPALQDIYADKEALLLDAPRLIFEQNIYGVDIDVRAAQIASLALWLRAQRSWHESGIKATDRPSVGPGNVIAAVAPPVETELQAHVAAKLEANDAKLFGETLQLLSGVPNLGLLFRVEHDISELIKGVFSDSGPLFLDETEDRWVHAEHRLREALTSFIQASGSSYSHRLFGQDALQCLRFIDLSRERFDVVVMNPPFGGSEKTSKSYLSKNYPSWNNNILCAFWSRAAQMLRSDGKCGAIFDRTAIVKSSYEKFRRHVFLSDMQISSVSDLGWDVLDANVETVSIVCDPPTVSQSEAKCFDLRDVDTRDKSSVLRQAVTGTVKDRTYSIDPATFEFLPNAVIGYDMPGFIARAFSEHPSLSKGGAKANPGLQLKMDAFGRLRTEVLPASIANGDFVPMYNGGSYSPFYMPITELAYWRGDGQHLLEHPSTRWNNGHRYFEPGIGYGKRGYAVDAHILPPGCLFTIEGLGIFPDSEQSIWYYLGLANSDLVSVILDFFSGQHKHAGYVDLLPVPVWDHQSAIQIEISELARLIYLKKWNEDRFNELSPFFYCDVASALHQTLLDSGHARRQFKSEIADLEAKCKELVERLFTLSDRDAAYVRSKFESFRSQDHKQDEITGSEETSDNRDIAAAQISYLVGCVFGRWDIDFATGKKQIAEFYDPFQKLPACPPGYLTQPPKPLGNDGEASLSLGLNIPTQGILVDDAGNSTDFVERVGAVGRVIWAKNWDATESDILRALGVDHLRSYFRNLACFFSDHVSLYSKGRRKAPIYWPLSTASGCYTLWIYYLELNDQTLFTTVNDFVEPKLKSTDDMLNMLRSKSCRSAEDERALQEQQDLQQELVELRDTILEIAPTYKPNHDDGVQITAAPLWQLFRHKPWQKVLKETWEKLEAGEYDWAHLAYSYWPDRVRDKCKTDKSLAIAHGLEEFYEEPAA